MEAARRADRSDLDTIVALAREASAELQPSRGGAIWALREARPEPIEVDLARVAAGDPERVAVVGTIDDVVVGYGVLHFEELHDGSRLAVITDLYVLAGARGVGVGEAMMDLLVEEARTGGAVGVDALALPGDRATKNFFERFGLTARAIVVHRALDDRPGGTGAVVA